MDVFQDIIRKKALVPAYYAAVKAKDEVQALWNTHDSLKPGPELEDELYEEVEDGEVAPEDDAGASDADGVPRGAHPPARSGRGVTMMQAWEAKKVSLKASLDKAREKRGKAIQKVFDQFENLLGHKARARWSSLIVRTCVKDHPATEPAPPPELSMKNLQKCHREFLLDVFQQDAAEN